MPERRPTVPPLAIRPVLPERDRREAARLYHEAFLMKLGPIVGWGDDAVDLLADALHPRSGVFAYRGERLVGVAGFAHGGGGLVDLRFRHLRARFGWWGAIGRAAIGALLDRADRPDELRLDGIAVDASARGTGAGTALLAALEDVARARGLRALRLDVVDTNPDARRLYERVGYRAVRTVAAPFGDLFGFRASTTMVKKLR